MKLAKHLRFLGLGLGLAATTLFSCSIPKPECTVGQTSINGVGLTGLSAFAVRYKLISSTGPECANFKGEVIGLQSFHPSSASNAQARDFSKTSIALRTQSIGELQWMNEDLIGGVEQHCNDGDKLNDPTKPDDPNPPDDDGDGLADNVDPDCHANAVGDFTTNEPGSDDLCKVAPVAGQTTITGASSFAGTTFPSDWTLYPVVDADTVDAECSADADCQGKVHLVCAGLDPMDPTVKGACALPESCGIDADCDAVDGAKCFGADPMTPGTCAVAIDLPKTDLKYEWSNITLYVTAAATGTQFLADVKITLNGCEAQYKAIGMWPAVDCTEFPSPDATETTTTACKADADCGDANYPTCAGFAAAKEGTCSNDPMKKCSLHSDCTADPADPVQCKGAKLEVEGKCAHVCATDDDCKGAEADKGFPTCADGTCSHLVTGAELCSPEPDALHGRPVGSGINPDFGPLACQTDVAVVGTVDQWYSLPDINGGPLSVPRCTIQQDTIPAIDCTKNEIACKSQ